MIEGIAKSASVPETVNTRIEHRTTNWISSPVNPDIPVDVYRFFNIDMTEQSNKVLDKLSKISKWAFDGSESLGDGMKKVRDLEIKLGTVTGGEQRYDKIYNYVLMDNRIKDLKKRQEALSRWGI